MIGLNDVFHKNCINIETFYFYSPGDINKWYEPQLEARLLSLFAFSGNLMPFQAPLQQDFIELK